MNITLFPYLLNNEGKQYIDVNVALDRIKTGTSKELVEQIQNETDKEKRSALKRQLPCLCFGGEFSKRAKSALENKSGLIVLDFDDVPNLLDRKQELANDPYTYAVFISPSGNGLKTVVKVDPKGNHEKQFDALKEKYPDVDISGRDISRVCFESFDPEIYVNPDSITWYEEKVPAVYVPVKKLTTVTEDETVRNLLKWWSAKYPASEGQRNTNLFKLACTLFDFGVQDVYGIVMSESNGLTEREVKTIVQSADRKTQENGSQGTQQFEPKQSQPVTLQVIPHSGDKPMEVTIDPKKLNMESLSELLDTRYKIEYNELTNGLEINGSPLSDQTDKVYWGKVDAYLKNNGSNKKLDRDIWQAGLLYSGQKKRYHPLKRFFEDQEWDGQTRLTKFTGAYKDKNSRASTYIPFFMLGCIERLYSPTYQNPALTLEGKSGAGKSFTAYLLGKPFMAKDGNGYYITSAYNPDDKDHRINQTKYFIWEWGEVAGLSKRDIESVKENFTKPYNTDRKPHGHYEERRPNVANFIITKNEFSFITDKAMTRRLNMVYLESVDLKTLNEINDDKEFMKQLWLEVYALWSNDKDKVWKSSTAGIDKELDQIDSEETPVFYDVLDKLVIKTGDKADIVTNADLVRAIRDSIGYWNDNRSNTQMLTKYMRDEQGVEYNQIRKEGEKFRGYRGVILKENPNKTYYS